MSSPSTRDPRRPPPEEHKRRSPHVRAWRRPPFDWAIPFELPPPPLTSSGGVPVQQPLDGTIPGLPTLAPGDDGDEGTFRRPGGARSSSAAAPIETTRAPDAGVASQTPRLGGIPHTGRRRDRSVVSLEESDIVLPESPRRSSSSSSSSSPPPRPNAWSSARAKKASARAYRESAIAALKDEPPSSRRRSEAIRLLERAVALRPRDEPRAWGLLAKTLEQAGDARRARVSLRRGLEAFPRNAELWRRLAELAKLQGDYAGARAYYGRAVDCSPRCFAAWDAWARMELHAYRNARAAAKVAERGLRASGAWRRDVPESARLWHAYGLALTKRWAPSHATKRALSSRRRPSFFSTAHDADVLGSNDTNDEPHERKPRSKRLADSRRAKKQLEARLEELPPTRARALAEGEAAFVRGLRADPAEAHLLHALGLQVYALRRDARAARILLRRAAERGQLEAPLSLARIEELDGRVEEARAAYRAACEGELRLRTVGPEDLPRRRAVLEEEEEEVQQGGVARRVALPATHVLLVSDVARWRSWARFESKTARNRTAALRVYHKACARHPRDVELRVQWARELGGDVAQARRVLVAAVEALERELGPPPPTHGMVDDDDLDHARRRPEEDPMTMMMLPPPPPRGARTTIGLVRLWHALGELEATRARALAREARGELRALHNARRAFYRGALRGVATPHVVRYPGVLRALVYAWAHCEWAIARRRGFFSSAASADVRRARRLFSWAAKLAHDADDAYAVAFAAAGRAKFELAANDHPSARRFAASAARAYASAGFRVPPTLWQTLADSVAAPAVKRAFADKAAEARRDFYLGSVHERDVVDSEACSLDEDEAPGCVLEPEETSASHHPLRRSWAGAVAPPIEELFGCVPPVDGVTPEQQQGHRRRRCRPETAAAASSSSLSGEEASPFEDTLCDQL